MLPLRLCLLLLLQEVMSAAEGPAGASAVARSSPPQPATAATATGAATSARPPGVDAHGGVADGAAVAGRVSAVAGPGVPCAGLVECGIWGELLQAARQVGHSWG